METRVRTHFKLIVRCPAAFSPSPLGREATHQARPIAGGGGPDSGPHDGGAQPLGGPTPRVFFRTLLATEANRPVDLVFQGSLRFRFLEPPEVAVSMKANKLQLSTFDP